MTRTALIQPSDDDRGHDLVGQGVVYCLACNQPMDHDPDTDQQIVCDPTECGWHRAPLPAMASSLARFGIPAGSRITTVWVIPATGHVPGVIYSRSITGTPPTD